MPTLPVTVALAAILAATGGTAGAQPAPENERAPAPSPSETRSLAAEHVTAAKGHYRAKRYDRAAREFELALALTPSDSSSTYNLARCRERQGKLALAVHHYRTYLRLAPEAKDATLVTRHVDKLETQLAKDHGQLEVRSSPSGAVVLLADSAPGSPPVKLGTTPLRRWLPRGAHRILLRLEGYQGVSQQTTLTAASQVTLDATLPPRPTLARVTLRCELAGAEVSVDGRPRGSTPLGSALELKPGAHVLRVTKEGHTAWEQRVELSAGDAVGLTAELSPAPADPPSAAIAAASGEPVAPAEGPDGADHQPADPPEDVEAPEAPPEDPADTEPAADASALVASGDNEQTPAGPATPPSAQPGEVPPGPGGEPGWRGPSGWAWTLLGSGVAGLAVGLGCGWAFLDAESGAEDYHAERQTGTRAEYDRQIQRAEALGLAANLGYGVAAIGLGGGLVLWWLQDEEPTEPAKPEPTTSALTTEWSLGPMGASLRLRW